MSDQSGKKLLEKNPMNSIAVPLAIVLVGALIIFGVTRMLSTDRSYRDLIGELESKTFGNRWVAAFELSKIISAKQVKEEDQEWLKEKLRSIYQSSTDPRTKEFLIVALGSMNDAKSAAIFNQALSSDTNHDTKFHALVAISKTSLPADYDWSDVYKILEHQDPGLVHAAIFTLSAKQAPEAQSRLQVFLKHEDKNIKYAAATALLSYKDSQVLNVIEEMLSLPMNNESYDPNKTQALKINVINALQKTKWDKLESLVERYLVNDQDLKVNSYAIDVLKRIKN
jgi:hypothetical protein